MKQKAELDQRKAKEKEARMAMLELFAANAEAEEEARIKAQGKDERLKAAMDLLDIDNDGGSYLPQALSMAKKRSTDSPRRTGRTRTSGLSTSNRSSGSSSSQSPRRQRHKRDGSLSGSY